MLVDTSGWVEMASPRDRQPKGGFHEHFYYIGLDIHKKTISYCIKAWMAELSARGK